MKSIYKHIISICIVTIFSGILKAQNRQEVSSDSLAARELKVLKKKLNLHSSQTKKLVDILKVSIGKRRDIKTTSNDIAARHALLEQIDMEQKALIKQLLTSEQWESYRIILEERGAAFKKYVSEKKISVIEMP